MRTRLGRELKNPKILWKSLMEALYKYMYNVQHFLELGQEPRRMDLLFGIFFRTKGIRAVYAPRFGRVWWGVLIEEGEEPQVPARRAGCTGSNSSRWEDAARACFARLFGSDFISGHHRLPAIARYSATKSFACLRARTSMLEKGNPPSCLWLLKKSKK